MNATHNKRFGTDAFSPLRSCKGAAQNVVRTDALALVGPNARFTGVQSPRAARPSNQILHTDRAATE